LVGAAVLVAAGIVLIPEMLSGPRDRVAEADGAPHRAAEAEGALKSYKIDLTRRGAAAGNAVASPPPESIPAGQATAAPPNEEGDALAASAAGGAEAKGLEAKSAQAKSAEAKGVADVRSAESGSKEGLKEGSAPPRTAEVGRPTESSVKSAGDDQPTSRPHPSSAKAETSAKSAATVVAKEPVSKAAKAEPPPRPTPVAAPSTGKTETAAQSTGMGTGTGKRTGWAVQIASYATSSRAQRVAEELKGKGFEAFVMPFKTGDKTLYRVRVGPEEDRKAAEADAAKLRAASVTGAVVKHP